jgi:uncharacterized membrane protein YhaH (DUF805 family)
MGIVFGIMFLLPRLMFWAGLDYLTGRIIMLILMIPVILFVLFILTYCMYIFTICLYHKGTKGNNPYGNDPLLNQAWFSTSSYWVLWIVLIFLPMLLWILKTMVN